MARGTGLAAVQIEPPALIAIEGIDGSGKRTQYELLLPVLQERYGADRVVGFSFPSYERTFFGRQVASFLNGRFGSIEAVDPHLAAILYAGDRFERKQDLVDALGNDQIVVCDRYSASNVAHQGARVSGKATQEFVRWIDTLENVVFGLPSPDLQLFLDVPPQVAWKLVLEKNSRSYTDRSRDLLEEQEIYLRDVYKVYKTLARRDDWCTVTCVSNHEIRTPGEIHEQVLEALGM